MGPTIASALDCHNERLAFSQPGPGRADEVGSANGAGFLTELGDDQRREVDARVATTAQHLGNDPAEAALDPAPMKTLPNHQLVRQLRLSFTRGGNGYFVIPAHRGLGKTKALVR